MQRNWLEAGEADRQLAYWKEALGNTHPVLQLPTDYPRDATSKSRAGRYTLKLASLLAEGLHRHANQYQATLFTLLLTGFHALLYRYTGQRDIRVGVTNANRNRVEVRGVVGLFVNTQVIRSEVNGTMTLAALLEQVRGAVLGAQEYQDLPFEQLVEALQAGAKSRSPAVYSQVMVNHQRADSSDVGTLPGLTMQHYGLGEQAARFDLALNTSETSDGGVGHLFHVCRGGLFDPKTIEHMGRQYVTVLQAMVDRIAQRLLELPLSSNLETDRSRWEESDRPDTTAPSPARPEDAEGSGDALEPVHLEIRLSCCAKRDCTGGSLRRPHAQLRGIGSLVRPDRVSAHGVWRRSGHSGRLVCRAIRGNGGWHVGNLKEWRSIRATRPDASGRPPRLHDDRFAGDGCRRRQH